MIIQLLLFVIAILLVSIFWELSKINTHIKKTFPLGHQEARGVKSDTNASG
jgi:hypothetical protein